jgi:hypothetical protein
LSKKIKEEDNKKFKVNTTSLYRCKTCAESAKAEPGTDFGVFSLPLTPIEKYTAAIRPDEIIKCPVCKSNDIEIVR